MDEGNFEYKNRRTGDKVAIAMDSIIEHVTSQFAK
jgi:prolyl-tRNA synthetase